jgi:ribosomal protein S18 acetylase RimI-like enzyme
MSEPALPFRAERYALRSLDDGRRLALARFTVTAADRLGPATAAIGPWAHYGFDGQKLAASFKSSNAGFHRFQVECGGELAGAIIVVCPWLSGPYLQMLAIQPAHQKLGIGTRILEWFEAEARAEFRNAWLCVSGFNVDAQRFYAAHGYTRVASLDDLMRDGDAELLMRKRLKR